MAHPKTLANLSLALYVVITTLVISSSYAIAQTEGRNTQCNRCDFTPPRRGRPTNTVTGGTRVKDTIQPSRIEEGNTGNTERYIPSSPPPVPHTTQRKDPPTTERGTTLTCANGGWCPPTTRGSATNTLPAGRR